MAFAALLAAGSAFAQSAAISASNPATLNQGNLRGATVSVTLTGTTYNATAEASHFTLTTAVPGLTVYSMALNSGRTVATLRLHYDGSDFNAAATIAVTVAADGTGHTAALTTSTQAIAPARWVNVSTDSVALTEGGSAGTYTVTLESTPSANVTVTVASDNAAVTRSPATLTFTTTNWNTAQTVTVTPVADNSDTVDELALVTNVATGGGYAASTAASRTVRVTVADDETRTGTDYDTDDDQLIEISGHAQLNAIRWDLDGNGSSANSGYASAFPSPAAGMGCPDGGDTNQTPDGCIGYELTANIDLDTDGDGSADSGDAYWNSGAGWNPIGTASKYTQNGYTATFRGNGHTISNLYMDGTDVYDAPVGLFAALESGARVESVGLLDVDVIEASPATGALVGRFYTSTLVGVYTQGRLRDDNSSAAFGAVAGECWNGRILASYSAVDLDGYEGGGLVGNSDACTIEASYARGPVTGNLSGGLVGGAGGAVTVSDAYWDRQTTGKTTSHGSPDSDGKTSAELQAPTSATGIFAHWNDYDLDGDGRATTDDDPWNFGTNYQYPVLKWGGHATTATAQFSAGDVAPTFGDASVSNKSYAHGTAITPFLIPTALGGNGAYDYTVSGLPTGLVFDEDGTGSCTAALTVCGTPTEAVVGRTVTVTVQDADPNLMAADQASLTFTVTVTRPDISVSPNSLSLREGSSATYTVALVEFAETTNVSVAVTSDNPAVTVSSAALTFTPQNWATPQTVTVTASSDADAVDEVATVTNAASGGLFAGRSATVRVSVDDDEESGTDYDADNDGLIDVDSLAKLNAMRWDLDGDGVASSGNETNYAAAFGSSTTGLGCPDGSDADQLPDACAGYELTADLDFDTDGDGDVDADDSYANWDPIGGSFTAVFDGGGHVISNLTIARTNRHLGLFDTVGSGGVVRSLGIVDANVTGGGTLSGGGFPSIGILAGQNLSTIFASYALGGRAAVTTASDRVGGLVGRSPGTIRASYSTAAVDGGSGSSNIVGGLVGPVTGGTISASYSAGPVTYAGSSGIVGGLVGAAYNSTAAIADSYCDALTGQTACLGLQLAGASGISVPRLATSAMQTPTAYGSGAMDVYADWDDLDTNGDGTVDADDDAWDFGTAYNHPALKFGGLDVAAQRTDYDADGDGLIDISTLGQLNAVRWDLDGDGAPVSANASSYFAGGAFLNPRFKAGAAGLCPTTSADADDDDCLGYELLNDLDFDTDGDGDVDANDPNSYPNWLPIGPIFTATFHGNNRTISNLTTSGSGSRGMFARVDGVVSNLGLLDVSVSATGGSGSNSAGGLAADNRGTVVAAYVHGGTVQATAGSTNSVAVGGLVGAHAGGIVKASFATAAVSSGGGSLIQAGGLAGSSSAPIAAAYATGTVSVSGTGTGRIGGLVGRVDYSAGDIQNAYAIGAASRTGNDQDLQIGGLVGNAVSGATATASYWDSSTTGQTASALGAAQTTIALQTPTAYGANNDATAIYRAWDDYDTDGDGTVDADDDAWDFGRSNAYPILKYSGLPAAPQLDAQPDTAPDFGAGSVANKTYQNGRAIQPFQIPAAGAGNGALSYAASGLPMGLVFDADGSGSCAGSAPRMVCGTPTTDTAAVTVTVTVSDGDSNEMATDEDTLTFTVEVVTPTAAISSPASLAEATLNGATVTVALTNAAFETTAAPAHFALATNPALSGLSVSSVGTVSVGDTSATLTLGWSGDFNTIRTLSVTVADAAHTLAGALTTGTVDIVPTPGAAVSRSSLSLDEGGSDGTYTVVLTAQPTGSVTVTATSSDGAVHVDTDATPLTRSLTFTTTNWNTAQTVTAAPQDDDDAEDESATISHAVSGYGAYTSAPSVTATVDDDETAGIVFDADPSTATVDDPGPVALQEDAAHAANSRTYTVRLAAQPTGTVTVTATSADTAAVTVDTAAATGLQSTLSFSTGNWDTAQTVTLAAVQDDDPNSETVAITHAAMNGGFTGVSATLQATVADDDVGVIVDTDPNVSGDQTTPIALREGQSRTYRVRLSTLPTGNVTVAVASDNAAITAQPASLAFTAQNWNAAQTVTVRGEQDGDAVGERGDISNTANGGQYAGETTTFRATAQDDDMRGTDYDRDDDGLIEIDSLAKLNAVRWDLDGDGAASSGNETTYRAAFAGSVLAEDMGCLDGPDADEDGDCGGYELTADLDFDTDGDGDVDADDPNSYANWTSIGGSYTATFHGNNHAISNLTRSGPGHGGLFVALGAGAVVSNLGLIDVDVSSTGANSVDVGALAGQNQGSVIASYVRGGTVSVSYNPQAGTNQNPANALSVGGLVGYQSGSGVIRACYATAAVSGAGSAGIFVGGLLGTGGTSTSIAASYATGSVSASGTGHGEVGGLVGRFWATITNSYATGAVSDASTSTLDHYIGGLVARSSPGSASASYWDSTTTGQSTSALGTTQTTSGLQTPTAYGTGSGDIYANWDDYDTNGDGTTDAADDAWDFGTAHNYPALKYAGMDVAAQRTDYDADGDGLIDISTLGQLNAVRWDLDGDGAPASASAASYFAGGAFLNPRFETSAGGLCPPNAMDADDDDCLGYELLNDLDFDTNGNGRTHTSGTGDTGDAWNDSGSGWEPIGLATGSTVFNAVFDGNGKVVDHLFVNRSRNYSGLFARTGSDAKIIALGLPDAEVRSGTGSVGALVGQNQGRVAAVWASGSVAGASTVGGLVGNGSVGTIVASYSTAAVACTGTSGAGLVSSIATGGSVAASYSTGQVTGATCTTRAGFVASNSGTVTASYWDATISQIADDTEDPPLPPEGRTTAQLQGPTAYGTAQNDIYRDWDSQDVDGDGISGEGEDGDPWDFGLPNQHPILKYRGLAPQPQLDAQPDTAPSFAATVADLTLAGAVAASFQLPAATAGNGAYDYGVSGLPAGLSFDEDGTGDCGQPRTVCGSPTTAGVSTVTYTVSDGDGNMASSDQDTLTFAVTVPPASAAISGTMPTTLTETTLNGARVTVELTGTAFGGLSPSSFALATTPTIAGLSVGSVARASATEATLTLRFAGDFSAQSTLLVRVLAAAHRFGGNLETATVAVMPAGGVALSTAALALDEAPGGANANVGTYTAVLAGQPTGTVTVTPASSNADVTTSGALTFSATNWNTAQTVTVTAAQDDDAVDDVAHLTHAVTGVPGVTSGPRVRVTVDDDDTQGLTLAATTLMAGVAEGATATYTAVLDTEPTGPVTVAIAVDAGAAGAATVDADAGVGGAQGTLLFNAVNWNTPQTVTVTAAQDDDGESETVTLTHDPAGADYGEVEAVDVSFTVTDDDTRGATRSISVTMVVQENSSRQYTLVLDTEPVGGDVSVAVASSDAATATASPSTLTFTARNWDVPQPITISGVDDADATDDSATVSHTPTGADYDGVTIPNQLVTVTDDDVAGLTVSPAHLTVAEGATGTYSVRLNVAPTAAVTVTVSGATAKLTADTDQGTAGDQTTLSFSATNWNTAQTVTVTAVEDADGADETVNLQHAVAGTGNYASLAQIRRPGIGVLVRDDETAGVVLSPLSLAIDEGGTAQYDVSLSAPPASGSATVTVAATGSAALTVDTATLTFGTTTWDTAQTVTVTAAADHTRLSDAAGTLTHAVAGYGAVDAGPDLPVRVANTTVDHDADADGLIGIDSLAKLNAMRWDQDGDGTASAGNAASYAAAFQNARGGSVCPTATSGVACAGFELLADLDFDTDGDGATHRNGMGDDGDDYDNGGLGWEPVGTATDVFAARFDGNGRLLRNLFSNRATGAVGLFGAANGRIQGVGLPNAWLRGGRGVGALAGYAGGATRVAASWSTGRVSGANHAGGLVGEVTTGAGIAASYSTAAVECTDTAANSTAGGLAGGQGNVPVGAVDASWSAGALTGGCPNLDGLVGGGGETATASYWDATASGIADDADGDPPEGVGTADLQSPTGYSGVFANWNIDLDGDYEADDPWDFGTSRQYPSLKWPGFDTSKQFAVSEEEPEAASGVPTDVRAEATTAHGLLVTWRAAAGATSYLVQWRLLGQAWSSARQAETTETSHEIVGLPAGVYEVRVLAVVDGEAGEPSAPSRGEAGEPPNRPPRALGLADLALDVGATAAVDLDTAFEDPDGDALRYGVSLDGAAAEAWVAGGTLRLRAMRPGEATATVTATDPDGLSAGASFRVAVGALLSLRGAAAAPEGGEAVLWVELSRALGADVAASWRLAADGDPGTADADAADFAAWAGTATIAAGETRARIVVAVLDDDAIEPARERFAVELEPPEDRNVGLSARAWRVLATVQEGVCDRTPEVRAELSRGWRGCRWPAPSDLARLPRLDLRGAGAEALDADDLLGLSGLRGLDLGGNALAGLPAGLLSHTPRLLSLRLGGNRLESLPAGLFAGLGGLRELRLAGNPGAPFALAPEMRREDAEPWAAGPATVRAHLPSGAPFGLRLALSAAGGEASAGGEPAEALAFAAGAVASGAARVSGAGPVRVLLAAPAIPETRCGDGPCFDGLAGEESALALFAAPPRVSAEVPAADLLSAGDARIDLSTHFAASGEAGGLAFSATVDDPRLADVSVAGSILTVSANEDGEEGTATVTVVATDDAGQTATLRFQVEVSPRPAGRWRGWRSAVSTPSAQP